MEIAPSLSEVSSDSHPYGTIQKERDQLKGKRDAGPKKSRQSLELLGRWAQSLLCTVIAVIVHVEHSENGPGLLHYGGER